MYYLFVLTDNNTSWSEINVFNVADVSVPSVGFEFGENILKSEIYGEYLIIATDDFSQEISVLNIGDIQNISIANSINLTGNGELIP
ncbi:MAG TPA: hypothetical protein PK957_04670 [Candidatus Dojkabacteria bacterium]|nr:hypothetical protein [Candidatus Dojkabacteria bacterium]HQF36778.1 hypothetical protein [Candidatus Dojkabacteria bacterium]